MLGPCRIYNDTHQPNAYLLAQPQSHKEKRAYISVSPFYFGADCRDRTGHLMITNQLLYQMS